MAYTCIHNIDTYHRLRLRIRHKILDQSLAKSVSPSKLLSISFLAIHPSESVLGTIPLQVSLELISQAENTWQHCPQYALIPLPDPYRDFLGISLALALLRKPRLEVYSLVDSHLT